MPPLDQPDDAAVEVSLREVVVGVGAPQLPRPVRVVLRHQVGQPVLDVGAVINRRAAAVARRVRGEVVDVSLLHARVGLVADRGVVLIPGRDRQPLLRASRLDLLLRHQPPLPPRPVELFEGRAVRRGHLVRAVRLDAELRHHLRRHIVDTRPVVGRDARCYDPRAVVGQCGVVVGRARPLDIVRSMAVNDVHLPRGGVLEVVARAVVEAHLIENGDDLAAVGADGGD